MQSINFVISSNRRAGLFYIALLMLFAVATHAQKVDDLYNQIQALQDRMKIQINGMEKIQTDTKILTNGTLEQQLLQLLASYNHVVTRNNRGQIERVVIVNKIQKQAAERIILPASFQDNHCKVSVTISGTGSVWQTIDMVVDTGADVVVIPESMIEQLGLVESQLRPEKMQTANGVVNAKVGLLQELRLVGEIIQNVPVAFINDDLLGKNALLGMAVLGRYQLTIDDQAKTVTLFKK